MVELDTSNGVMFPLYDPDANLVYLCGKVSTTRKNWIFENGSIQSTYENWTIRFSNGHFPDTF
jgi:hypothetical protein